MYELLMAFLEMARERWGGDQKIEKLAHKIQRVLQGVHSLYVEVKELELLLNELRRILKNEEGLSGDAVKRRFLGFVDGLKPRSNNSLWDKFLKDLRRMVPRWSVHLFFTYDDKDIPRTNNQMEQSIKEYKMMIRAMMKRRNTSDFAVRHGPALVMLLDYFKKGKVDVLGLLHDVTPAEYSLVSKMASARDKSMKRIGLSAKERQRLIKELEKYIRFLDT